MTDTEGRTGSLLTAQFVILCGIFFLTTSVMAMFFQFQQYLRSLGINPGWIGFVIGADSLACFFIQPFLAVRLNAANSRKWVFIGTSGMAVMLLSYTFAPGLPYLIVVRILHGAAFVCVMSALTALLSDLIPSRKSGQAFGLVTIVRLLPYSIVPPLLTFVDRSPEGFRTALIYGALVMAASLTLVYRLDPSSRMVPDVPDPPERLKLKEMAKSLARPEMRALFATSLFLYSSYTTVFFFLKAFGQARGMDNPGFFFTIANAVMIGIRLVGGSFFDKVSKKVLTAVSMAGLAICYGLLFHASGIMSFYVLAFAAGLGWGIAMPVLTALVFDVSPPHLRSMNLNLFLITMQGGFFVGPFLGGLLAAQWGYGALFYFCASMSMAGAVLIQTWLRRPREQGVGEFQG